MTEQERITLYRFAAMRTKLDTFEDLALVELLGSYKQATKELVKDLDTIIIRLGEESYSVQRARALLDEVSGMSQVIQRQLTGDISDMTVEAGLYSYRNTNEIVSWDGLVKGFNNVSLSAAQLQAYSTGVPVGGKILEQWVSDTFDGYTDQIKGEIGTGLIKGESYRKIVDRLQETIDIGRRDATTLARSYVQDINVKAATDIYDANKEVVNGVEWTAIMEGGNVATGRGTCPRCQALDGQRYIGKETPPQCPLHPRCRCMLLPVTKTWKELGFDVEEMDAIENKWTIRADRAIDTGGVPIIDYGTIDSNYAGWWKTRSISFQNNSIGPTRAGLVRDGLIDFQDIVDRKTGELILLRNLKPKGGGSVPSIPKKPTPRFPSPVSSLEKVVTLIPGSRVPSGVFLQGVRKVDKQDILDGMNKSVVKYKGELNSIGWQVNRRRSLGVAANNNDYILFQKTGTKRVNKDYPDRYERWNNQRLSNIETVERYIKEPRRAALKDRNIEKLEKLKAIKRWAVFTTSDNPLRSIAIHEGFHNVYNTHSLSDKFRKALENNNVTVLDRFRLSEYGASKTVELFAELGTAIEENISIPDSLLATWKETMKGI